MTVGIYKQTATDVMSKNLVTIHPQQTVYDALVLMSENQVSALPVVDSRSCCVGVISQADLIDAARAASDDNGKLDAKNVVDIVFGIRALEDLTSERIEDVMSEKVVTGALDESVVSLSDRMLINDIHHVPICDAEGRLRGIVSTMDILNGLRRPISS